jgi:hypothetical protein
MVVAQQEHDVRTLSLLAQSTSAENERSDGAGRQELTPGGGEHGNYSIAAGSYRCHSVQELVRE